MQPTRCPVCKARRLQFRFAKHGVDYWSCVGCGALFAPRLADSHILTHNQNPEDRALHEHQETRLARIEQHLGRKPDRVLDFGCGHGDYVRFLRGREIDAVGIDRDTELQLRDLKPQFFDAINMVEVIEHLLEPEEILRKLVKALKPDGVLYVESSFVDDLGDLLASPYIDPRIGHCCIHSRASITLLAKKLRLETTWINQNVPVFRKQHRRWWMFG